MADGGDRPRQPDAATLAPALPDAVIRAAVEVLGAANDHGLRIATAESCTGGLLASLLTDVEGFSKVFDRGFVTYSNQAKHDLLGLDLAMIEAAGAVSEPTARAMAEGALARSHADVAIATTGFAGRAGPTDEPGLVHFAGTGRGIRTQHRVHHFGDIGRAAIRIECLHVALDLLATLIAKQPATKSR